MYKSHGLHSDPDEREMVNRRDGSMPTAP